ncbi:MAG: hypothetical protein K2X81_00850, partial [Candidatus Obscuribacterales bacterium]|nr:hypothetical protein [Candidatus Obscuribacterales bacterium]
MANTPLVGAIEAIMDLSLNCTVDRLGVAKTSVPKPSRRFFGLIFALSISVGSVLTPAMASKPGAEWADSPLPVESQVSLTRAGKLMKSAKYDKAKPIILSALESANDVPKCLAIAQYTEAYGFPMMEVRRKCCDKALSLCSTDEDYLLMALKARKYQFFEVTRDSIHKLIETSRTMPQLFVLARKAHELALNDVAHLALEKAYTGIKTQDDAFTFVDNCKSIGMDDLMRKALKLVVDDEDESIPLCEIATHIQKYGMRDEVRYALRKALDHTSHDLG